MTDKERVYYKAYYANKLKKQGKKPLVDKILARREKVCALKNEGRSHSFIAKNLHVTVRTVTNDIKALKSEGRL